MRGSAHSVGHCCQQQHRRAGWGETAGLLGPGLWSQGATDLEVDSGRGPASHQASVSLFVQSGPANPDSLDPSPGPGQTCTQPLGLPRDTQAHAHARTHTHAGRTQTPMCRHVSVYTDTLTHKHTLMQARSRSHKQTHRQTHTHICTQTPHPVPLPRPPHLLTLTLTLAPPLPPQICCAPTVGTGGAGSGKEQNPRLSRGRGVRGAARAREMTARGPPRVPAHEY